MSKPKIFLEISQVANCGVGYYRQWLPLKKLEEQGLIELRVMDFNWGDKEIKYPYQVSFNGEHIADVQYDKEFLANVEWCDLIYICRDESSPFIAVNGGLKEYFKKPLIVDIDDYVQFTRPHNPGYISFNPMSPYNKNNLKLLRIADGMTVSTDYLKKVYKNENRRISVCPNSLDVEFRDKSLGTKLGKAKGKNEIRIGWAGSSAHFENLRQIEKPLYEIMKKYPNVTFHYTGLYGDLFKSPDVKDRVFTVRFAPLKEWGDKLVSMGLDIALAPLMDNHFNRAKSNLRVLEYWAAKFPVIASPVEPYRFIKDGKDGLLAMEDNEWFDAMEKLILDVTLRNSLVDNGYKRLKEEYNASINCKRWLEVFNKFLK